MSKTREKAVCVVSGEEVETWNETGVPPDCSEHRHISQRDARMYVYPWQSIGGDAAPTAKIVGQHKGRVCIQMIAAREWKTRSRSNLPRETGMRYLAVTTQQLVRN